MMFNCPVCGKYKCAFWPENWIYRRGETYYCSENCYVVDLTRDMKMIHNVMRQRRERKMGKLTLEIKKKAVEIAIDGGDPIEYLKRNGYEKAPDKMWSYIKMKLKEKDPATFAKIPDRRKVKKPEIPEPISGGPWEKMETPEDPVKLTGPIRIEPEEPQKIDVLTPEMMNKAQRTAERLLDDARKEKEKNFGLPSYINGFEICGISGQFGTYRASAEHNYFEFVPFGGDLCMNPGDWRDQIEELNKAAKVLGVKL